MRARHLLVLAMLGLATNASAMEDSKRGPFYVQGTVPLGLHFGISLDPGGNWAGWRPDIEFGAHFNGRHDGFVLGLRQAFILTAAPQIGAGTTQLRYGYDLSFPVGENFELVVAPYGTVGIGYTLSSADLGGPNAGLDMSWGVDGKFFFAGGFYGF